jgi:hypothetical protein
LETLRKQAFYKRISEKNLTAAKTYKQYQKLFCARICGPEANKLALTTAQKLPDLALLNRTKAHASTEIIYNAVEGLKERFRSAVGN